MTRAELIKALESLEGPSREMDLEIARIQDTVVLRHNRETGSNYEYTHHLYTSSIDSALTLVPEGWRWDELERDVSDDDGRGEQSYGVTFNRHDSTGYIVGSQIAWGSHDHLAIALCIAALKAQESTQ